jgi:two-component system chemotaxis sensor kinase CheA
MSKYKALFVEESREHLAELSRLLVRLESTQEPATLVDDIFRRVHSLKGMAASMGFEAMATLAHAVEDLVAKGRAQGGAFAPAVVDLLLRATDALGDQLGRAEADAALPHHAELVAEIGRAAGVGASAGDGAPAGVTPLGTTTSSSPTAGVDGAGWLVHVTMAPDCQLPAVRLFMVHKRLAELGQVVASTPSLEALRAGRVAGRDGEYQVQTCAEEESVRRAVSRVADVAQVAVRAVERVPSGTEHRGAAEASVEATRASSVRVRTEVLDALIDDVGELFILRARLDSLLARDGRPDVRVVLDALSKAIRAVHGQVMTVRMVPMRTVTDRYPRLVRDLARSLGRAVELSVEGSEIELDRAIIEALDEPLVHVLRNAIDHGIEAPEERLRLGKPRAGTIKLSATRDRDTVLVVLEDDGRGLDPEALRKNAVEQGLLSAAQADGLTTRDCLFLICMPRFSTKRETSAVSGRGVGMDAVRSRIEALGGTLDIESEMGRSTRFVFRLPLTVAIINVLLVETCGRLFALPVAKVVAVRETGTDTIKEASGATYLSFRHALAPVFDLAGLLGLSSTKAPEHAVIVEDGRDLIAVAVDRVAGYHEVVVKPLGEPLDHIDWYTGAAILGDGRPILILDLPKGLRSRWAA